MAVFSNCICMDFVVVLVSLIICVVTYFKWAFKYWKRRDVPFVIPQIPFGTMLNPFLAQKSFAEAISVQYKDSKRKRLKHVGLYTFAIPIYMPIDVEYIKDIMSKKFNHFVDRGFYFNEKDDPLSAHLFALEGTKWKNLRTKLTPTFTSGKMKMMFNMLLHCGEQLMNAVDENVNKNVPIDIKDLSGRFTSDVIGTCAFGIDCNSFKNPNSEFRRFAQRVFVQTKWEICKILFSFTNPVLARMLRVSIIPKDVSTFFLRIVKEAVEYRNKNKVIRHDFLQLLLELKDDTDRSYVNEDGHLTIEELTAQAFVFFIAAYETSSQTMAFCLFELAQNQDIQDKVRDEINSILGEQEELTYDRIKEMKYMKQVIDEILRKYPALPMLTRKCVLDYKISDTDIIIEKGTNVVISLLGLHYDPEYFPDPEKFDPDRFSSENKNNILPFTYMPFGEGPRLCIGMRFGLMQTGVGLTLLLRKFRFSLSEKTKLPFKMNPQSFTLAVLGDIWLNVAKV